MADLVTAILVLLRRRKDDRDAIRRDALAVIASEGPSAYFAARERMRACRRAEKHDLSRHWSKVAVLIAQRTGYAIGEKVADRMERVEHEAGKRWP